mgnify:FL=1
MNTLLLNTSINTSLGHTIVTLVAFVILLLIVKRFAWGPLTKILLERKQVIDHDIQTAASEKAAAQDANRDAQLALRDARAEATQIILQAKKQSLQVQDTMLKEAKEEVIRMKETAQKDIALERRRMLSDLRAELTDISIEIAEKIIQREIKPEDYHRLVDDFIERMDDLS